MLVLLLMAIREELGSDLNDFESEPSGLLFSRSLC